MVEIVQIGLQQDGSLRLPESLLAVLNAHSAVYVQVDAAAKTLTISGKHPDALHNDAILAQLAALNADLSWADYADPVADGCLQQRHQSPQQSPEDD